MSTSPPEPPAWMYTVPADTLDRRVLEQAHHWITIDGQILELHQMSRTYLANVLAMLRGMAATLHLGAMVDVLVGNPADLAAEVVTFQLTGSSLASVSPRAWLEATPLMRSIRHLLAAPDVVDDDPEAGCARPPTQHSAGRDSAPDLDI